MANLKIQLLTENTSLCFEYSRNNAIFNSEQRKMWLIKAFEQKGRLAQLIGEELSNESDPTIIEANTKMSEVNIRLKNKQESINKFIETIQNISDSISILDTLIGFIVPSQMIET
jgi:hypothetical protein